MPIIHRAIKKLRHDRKRAVVNAKTRANLRGVVKNMRQHPTKKALAQAYSTLDKAAKTHIIHANKAARLKTRLAKLIASK